MELHGVSNFFYLQTCQPESILGPKRPGLKRWADPNWSGSSGLQVTRHLSQGSWNCKDTWCNKKSKSKGLWEHWSTSSRRENPPLPPFLFFSQLYLCCKTPTQLYVLCPHMTHRKRIGRARFLLLVHSHVSWMIPFPVSLFPLQFPSHLIAHTVYHSPPGNIHQYKANDGWLLGEQLAEFCIWADQIHLLRNLQEETQVAIAVNR